MTIAHVWYSASVHGIILVTNGVSVWLVVEMSKTDPAFTYAAHRSTLLAFGFFSLIYLILKIFEAKPDIDEEIRKFVGHLSHLSGGLAALSLISLLSPISAACLAPIWLVWLLAVGSITFANIMFPEARGESRVNLPV